MRNRRSHGVIMLLFDPAIEDKIMRGKWNFGKCLRVLPSDRHVLDKCFITNGHLLFVCSQFRRIFMCWHWFTFIPSAFRGCRLDVNMLVARVADPNANSLCQSDSVRAASGRTPLDASGSCYSTRQSDLGLKLCKPCLPCGLRNRWQHT